MIHDEVSDYSSRDPTAAAARAFTKGADRPRSRRSAVRCEQVDYPQHGREDLRPFLFEAQALEHLRYDSIAISRYAPYVRSMGDQLAHDGLYLCAPQTAVAQQQGNNRAWVRRAATAR